jgi:hypothetical protein
LWVQAAICRLTSRGRSFYWSSMGRHLSSRRLRSLFDVPDLRDVLCTRSNERSDPESGSSKAPARGARPRQIGVEAATDHAFLHEMGPSKGETIQEQSVLLLDLSC